MASEGSPKKKQTGKGFAGLDSMLSNVDDSEGRVGSSAQSANALLKNPDQAARQRAGKERPPPQPITAQPQPNPRSSGSSRGKWLLKWGGVALMVCVIWQIAASNRPSSRLEYSPPAASTDFEFPAPDAETDSFATDAIAEERPPVGTGRVLTTAQIRYCVSETIRMEGAKNAFNLYVEADVDRFNVMVQDYNNRCGNFRYRAGTLEGVQSEAERKRDYLEAIGRSRFLQTTGGG